jgi:flagellin
MAGFRSSFSTLAAARMVGETTRAVGRSLERLATGKKINRASDDPAGMVAVNGMESRRKSIQGRMNRLDREAHTWGARDGALSVLSDLMLQLEDHVVSAANVGATGQAERERMQTDVDDILRTIDHLSATQRFGDEVLLAGWNSASMGVTDDGRGGQVGLAALRGGGTLNLVDGDMELAQKVVKTAASSLAQARAEGGNRVKAIDSEIRGLQDELVNLSDAQSRIEDVDYAQEVSELVRRQVLQEASRYAMSMMIGQHRSFVASLLG